MKIKKKTSYGKLRNILFFRINELRLKQSETILKKNLFLNFFLNNFFLKAYKQKNFFFFYNNYFKNYKQFFFVNSIFNLKKLLYNDNINYSVFLNSNFNKSIFFNKNNLKKTNYGLSKNKFNHLSGMSYLIKKNENFFELINKNDDFNNLIIFYEKIDNIKKYNFNYFFNYNIHTFNVIEFYKILILIQFNFIFKNNYRIYIRTFRPTNNSLRFKKKISSFYTNNTKFKRLTIGTTSKAGKNNYGLTMVRHRSKGVKKSFIFVDYKRNWTDRISLCLDLIKSSQRNCLLALIKFSNGTFSYILASHGLKPGNVIYTSIRPPRFSLKYKIGCSIIIRYLDLNTIFFNLELIPGKGGVYSRSAGTFCKVINFDFKMNEVQIQLPTNIIKTISIFCFVSLGRASNIDFNKQFFSKAGYFINKGRKQSVRGVAMNPVDHPHGGRTKTSSPELTPWGKIAKRNK